MVRFFVCAGLLLLLSGCGSESDDAENRVTQQDIINSYAIERLKNETFYFHATEPVSKSRYYQPLKRFDLIFVGHDSAQSGYGTLDIARSIPGLYTHMLAYIGKDSDGFAYAVEMNTDENQSYTLGLNGLKVGGHTYVYCIGSDFGLRECPVDDHIYGLETYDYMVAKRLTETLRTALMAHEAQLIATMKEDLLTELPFQLPFDIGLQTMIGKKIGLVDDGRIKGADCTAYFTGLFEEVAGVCMDNIRMNAATLSDYFLNDPFGQEAMIPEAYNFFTHEGDLYFSELLGSAGYQLVDNTPRQTLCSDGRIVQGIPTPDLVFGSPSMEPIERVYEVVASQ